MRINSYFSNALFNRDKLAPPRGFVPGANTHSAFGGLGDVSNTSNAITHLGQLQRFVAEPSNQV